MAAGMIRVTSEKDGFYQDWVDKKVSDISDTLLEIFVVKMPSLGLSWSSIAAGPIWVGWDGVIGGAIGLSISGTLYWRSLPMTLRSHRKRYRIS